MSRREKVVKKQMFKAETEVTNRLYSNSGSKQGYHSRRYSEAGG